MTRPIGAVQSLWRFPVKSMGGESIEGGFVSFAGLVGDRCFALVDRAAKPGRDLFTAREHPALLRYSARAAAGHCPEGEVHPELGSDSIEVVTPQGETVAPGEGLVERLRAETGRDLRLRGSERGMVDAFPLSILGASTVAQLSVECASALDPLRFRANLSVDWVDSTPFYEDTLVGRSLRIGEQLTVHIVKRDGRCKIVNLCPDSAAEDPAVLRAIGKNHEGYTGVYAAVLREGVVRPGDLIQLAD